jgi:hypothetical protein
VHYYDGSAALLFGPTDADAEASLVAGTPYEPVLTESGHGIAVLDLATYPDTDLGGYQEAMFAFVVHTGDTDRVPDDPGAMIAAALNPHNTLWIVRLILDSQLGIDAGREYLGLPKEAHPDSMHHDISTSQVTVQDAEPDGRSILRASIPIHAGLPPTRMATRTDDLSAIVKQLVAHGGNAFLQGAFSDVRHPHALSYMQGAVHIVDPADTTLAAVGTDALFVPNSGTPLGADLVDLAFTPQVVAVISGLRLVIDLSL